MIGFIVTEHPSALDAGQWERYHRAADVLREVGGEEVGIWPYLECDRATWACDGIVLSGSSAPWSAHRDEDLAALGAAVRGYGGPVFGICAGLQLLATFAGGAFGHAARPEQGFTPVTVRPGSPLFAGLPDEVLVYEHHTDEVTVVPQGARVVASSPACAVQALEFDERPWWGTQFHPELADGDHGAGAAVLGNAFALLRGAAGAPAGPSRAGDDDDRAAGVAQQGEADRAHR